MEKYNAEGWLVNTGWVGGAYGKGGNRIDLPDTRRIIDAILNGELDRVEYELLPVFNLRIPKSIPGIKDNILNPRNIWKKPEEWDEVARSLAAKFIKNFENFSDTEETRSLISSGPRI
jgi:phosphoenolpyruvate carboxykinase (ATP)